MYIVYTTYYWLHVYLYTLEQLAKVIEQVIFLFSSFLLFIKLLLFDFRLNGYLAKKCTLPSISFMGQTDSLNGSSSFNQYHY